MKAKLLFYSYSLLMTLLLVIGLSVVGYTAISQEVGFNLWDVTNSRWLKAPGDQTNGLDVDVTRVSGSVTVIGNKTPAAGYANPTDAVGTWALLGAYNTATWDQVLSSTHGNGVATVRGINVASIEYLYNGTNYDRVTSAPTPAALGTARNAVYFLQAQTLLTSSARTTSSNSGALTSYGSFKTMLLELNVTAASGTTPTLDVYIDTSADSTNFINIAHFTQLITTGRRAIQISDDAAGAAVDFDSTADLAAGVVKQGAWGSTLRVRWVITGTTPSFTFSVIGTFKS